MSDLRIDIHTHALHPKIAAKVVEQLKNHYGVVPVGSGVLEDLLARLARAGLDQAAVHSAATSPAQVIPANNWAIQIKRACPQCLPFGTMHPGWPDFEAEFDRLEAAGVTGLKFHADFQGFRLDSPAFRDVLAAAEGRFVAMFHVGDRLPPDQNPSCPRKLADIHRDFPGLTIIAAHFGGYLHWPHALEHLAGLDIYLDTSSSLPYADPVVLRAIMDRHAPERMLYGSDYPLFDPGEEVARLRSYFNLSDSALERLLTNANVLFPDA